MRVTVTILVPETFVDEAADAPLESTSSLCTGGSCDDGSTTVQSAAERLVSRLNRVNSDKGIAQLGAVTVEKKTKEIQVTCPRGFYCSAGIVTPCPADTYGTEVDAYFAGNCTLCPENAVTDQTGATSFEMCKCSRSYYMAGTSPPNAQCVRCPLPGTACTDQGVTLDSLPLEHGYWRPGYSSLDVRPCPDQSEGNTSACGGGVALCKAGLNLTGVYCRTCLEEDTYFKASSCSPCGPLVENWSVTFAGLALLVLSTLLIVLGLWRVRRVRSKVQAMNRQAMERGLQAMRRFHLASKL